ncbi:efflux RND transporter periplasmic adaptor subunit [Paenibacillus sp. R14(2021)]|uniref:efflux RND transporter periplasmic adaptor subunit n=1 Tax=Paenibacillus sp. R14(2021) TaxID=2859228 RepID=UPI001C615031|nr:efflux RND transporter periplasmic adaptor subunit [Paenibacillus sp. R14(2021)]
MSQSQTRNRRRKLYVKEAAAALLAVSLLSGCSLVPTKGTTIQPPLIKPAAEKVDAVDVKKGNIERYFSGTAVVASSHNVPLFYKESGRLKELFVTQGEKVKAGQLIAELDRGDLDLRVQLEKLAMERVQIEYNRAKKEGVTGTDLRMKEIDLEREQLVLESMLQQLATAKLTAAMSGVISYSDTKSPGDGVNGYTPLVVISDPTQTRLVYTADDPKQISAIEREMAVEVSINGKKLAGKVLQAPLDAPLTGNKDIDERNMKLLYIGLSDPAAKLPLGASADIRIGLEKKENVIVIPRSGLRTYLGRTYVQIVDGDRRKEVDVEPGVMTQTEVEIVKGLEAGMKVVLNN